MKLKKKYFIIAFAIVAIFAAVIISRQIINAQPERIYSHAKSSCQSEIWLVEQDAVWTDVRGPIRKPYPENLSKVTGERVIDFACDQKSAEQKK